MSSLNHVLGVGAFKVNGDGEVEVTDPEPTNEVTSDTTSPKNDDETSPTARSECEKEKEISSLRTRIQELETRLEEENLKSYTLNQRDSIVHGQQREIARLETALAASQEDVDLFKSAMGKLEGRLRERGRELRSSEELHQQEIRRLEAALADAQNNVSFYQMAQGQHYQRDHAYWQEICRLEGVLASSQQQIATLQRENKELVERWKEGHPNDDRDHPSPNKETTDNRSSV